MLPFKNRLTRKEDFQLVHKNGKFFSVKSLSLLCLPNNLTQTRIGFVVSKKNLKKATDRNRIRRFLREAFRQKIANIKPGLDIVVHSKLEKSAKLKEIETLVNDLLRKSKLLN